MQCLTKYMRLPEVSFFFQVAVLDWNKETGLKTVNEFVEIFGDDSVHFIECDVSRKIDLESGSYEALAIMIIL